MRASVPLTNYGDLLPIDTMSDAVLLNQIPFSVYIGQTKNEFRCQIPYKSLKRFKASSLV